MNNGLPLVADAACAVGATYKGQPFGTFADVSVISFNGNKTITCGGGGMVVGSNPELMGRIRHLTTTAKIGEEYDFDMVGFNYRMTNIQAAVGCAQMERLNEFVSVKKKIRETYAEKLEGGGISFFPTATGSSCWLSGIVLPEGRCLDDARQVCRKLRILGIESRTFWKPVHLQAPYRNIIHSQMNVSENLWERVVTLPCSTNITEKELELVVKSVKEVLKF